jgi:hypothetical protein
MQLYNVSVRNVGIFRSFGAGVGNQGSRCEDIVIMGRGKTTLLNLIARSARLETSALPAASFPSPPLVQTCWLDGEVNDHEVTFEGDSYTLKQNHDPSSKLLYQQLQRGFVYYPADRSTIPYKLTKEGWLSASEEERIRFRQRAFELLAELGLSEEWIPSLLVEGAPVHNAHRKGLASEISLPHPSLGFRLKSLPVYDESLPGEYLSLFWIFDLLFRAPASCVLVDAVDASAPLVAQVELLAALRKVFPETQFILSAQHPLLLSSGGARLWRFARYGDEVTLSTSSSDTRLLTLKQLYAQFTEVGDLSPRTKEFREYARIAHDPLRTKKDEKRMREIRKKHADLPDPVESRQKRLASLTAEIRAEAAEAAAERGDLE